jgi:Ca-activated chloride channel family protein
VLANPALTFTGDIRATKLYQAPLPDLFRGDQLVLVGRYSGQGDAAAVLGGSVNGATKKFSYDVRFPGTSPENDFIASLWATRRVGWLLDEIRLHGENAELKDEVTDLARKYGIVTPYTAYLIVEDETKRGVAVNVQTLPQLRQDAAAYSMAGQAYDSLAKEKSGAAAVAGARYGLAMQQAAGASSLRGAQLEARRALVAAAPSLPSGGADVTVVDRVTQYTQQQRCVGGRTFFQNGRQWTEAQVQQQSQARKVRVAFGSPDYFELLEKQPQTRAWLALGQNVQFVLHGIVYEIFDDTGKNKS